MVNKYQVLIAKEGCIEEKYSINDFHYKIIKDMIRRHKIKMD
jgi:hypothetical protein